MLLREIISALKKIHERNPEAVAVTASTGLAACNVGGITLHSFAAFGLGKEDVADLAKKIKRNKKGFDRWRRTKVLIIDESTFLNIYCINLVSMVDASLFDKLEALARILRRDEYDHSVEFNSSSQEISFNYHPSRITVEKLNSLLKPKVGIAVSNTPSNYPVSSVKKIRVLPHYILLICRIRCNVK